MRVLVAGHSVRHIACSAARAGHTVFAADGFCDLDLEACAKAAFLIPRSVALLRAEEMIQIYVERFSPDAVVLGPGMEEARVRGVRVLSNPTKIAAKVSDKLWLAGWLERRGFPFIPTSQSAEDACFPAVVKPRKGAGGADCLLARSAADLEMKEGMIIQDLIEGVPLSASVIGSGSDSRAIAVNWQIIGASWAGAEGFRYCGNITPFDPPHPEMVWLAQDIVSELGLVGSSGVDLLLTEDGPVVVEVNPRFQGSLDAVELSTGMSVFQAHLEAFDGHLPEIQRPRISAGRAIIYAEEDSKVWGYADQEWTADIPRPGSELRKGDPIASVLATGEDRKRVLELLMKRAGLLRMLVKTI